jgi:signal transduction histidine kinase
MKSSAVNIYELLENLLEWSRLKRGGLHFVGQKLNLRIIVNDCVAVLSESARKKEIGISIMIPEEIEVFADKHMLATVIRNIVSNAIKFSNPGGKVTLTAIQTDKTVEVKISDTGIGMYPELKEKLFLINEKTSRHGTAGELSTGLGLLLCKEFIDQSGGKIWVESVAGQGSAFFFTITAAS